MFNNNQELYADDCSIFLKPTEENLRNVLGVLQAFYEISGLKISLTKTKAVWFGLDCKKKLPICPDLRLDWDNSFKLLGDIFNNNLEGMEINFDLKIKEIKKLLHNWINRNMSVYGKVVIIKSLALSKLSHLAMILPSLNHTKLNKQNNYYLSFYGIKSPTKYLEIMLN